MSAGKLKSDIAGQIADAVKGNWVDRYAPKPLRPYLKLARLDRPIGSWLLLWPCWWSAALAGDTQLTALPPLWLFVLFGLGAVIMRGAGCVFNDIADRDIDAKVDRTLERPLASGQVSLVQTLAFLGFLLLLGLVILLQFNWFSVWLGASSLILVVIYPFMKRITYWPQLFLGLAFNWGALLGWSAVTGSLHPAAAALYAGGILWTIGYDTIYAHMDKDDDILIGVKSTALRFGAATHKWIAGLYGGAALLFALALFLSGARVFAWLGLLAMALHMLWQLSRLQTDNAARCLQLFRANREAGLLFFAGIVLDALMAGYLVG
ncbi:MAG: 4-hydroxybenzoate octaprenyltransferase [Hyphomicrobiales bacterium]|nr:MAG: 4-hydroxybenzoate octaprenyltransferase [Hyphomicrobiales bacterium]